MKDWVTFLGANVLGKKKGEKVKMHFPF